MHAVDAVDAIDAVDAVDAVGGVDAPTLTFIDRAQPNPPLLLATSSSLLKGPNPSLLYARHLMSARQPFTSSGYGSPGLSLRAYMGQRGSPGPLWMASGALLDTLTTKPGRLWPSQAGRARLAGPGRPRLASPTPKPFKSLRFLKLLGSKC